MNEKKTGAVKEISHSSYELLRRLPPDPETIITMCASLKEDFAERHLIESAESKEQRKRYRQTSKTTSRGMLAKVHQALFDTAADLDIQVQQVITLLVFLHDTTPSWTVRHRAPNKLPRKLTPIHKPRRKRKPPQTVEVL